MLMTSIALDCGYPASSLRERVYAGDDRYGIFLDRALVAPTVSTADAAFFDVGGLDP